MPKFYIALEEGGVPKFSANPVLHHTGAEAIAEGQRLARLHRGATFGLYAKCGVADFYVAPQPVVKTYTGRELHTTAPPGTYEQYRAGLPAHKARVVVLHNESNVALLACAYGDLQPLHSSAWDLDTFIKVSNHNTLKAQ